MSLGDTSTGAGDEVYLDSLARLLQAVRAGDSCAQTKLLVLCRGYLYLQAELQLQGKLTPRVDASDVVQQALLEAWDGLAAFRGTTSAELMAWLKQIVVRNSIDLARRHHQAAKRSVQRETPMQGHQGEDDSQQGLDPASPEETPSQYAIKQEEELQLAEAIAELSPDYQRVLMLRSFLRLSFADVAEQMQRSRPAAQMLWARAVEELRHRLDETEAGSVDAPVA
jgi:RNA polymerase sigma-70 factor, ECF subfamily